MPYFDHNATTPLCPPAREAWLRVQDRLWHNASSLYREAAAARDELEWCREQLAEWTGTESPERIVFTSGATEGCNGFFRACSEAGAGRATRNWRVFISPYEHPAVREPVRRFCHAETLEPMALDRLGQSLAAAGDVGERSEIGMPSAPAPGPLVVAWMAANNETGEIFPWQRWGGADASERFRGALHFCDASQWLGKLPASGFAGDGPYLVGCAHKFGGPKGVGFARIAGHSGMSSDGLCQIGGPQEHGLRAGTEDVAGVAAMVAALRWCEDQLPGDAGPRDEFEHGLGWPVVAGDRPRLWNTSMVIAPRHSNKLWLARLSQHGFQCSTGSACSSGKDGDSHVLAAMGLDPDAMRRALRFSAGWSTTPDDWRALLVSLGEVAKELDAR